MEALKFKKNLLYIWNKFFEVKNIVINQHLKIKDKFISSFTKPPIVKSMDETLLKLIKNNASVGRYGDGEFKLINNQDITFQQANPLLSKRLKEILLTKDDNFLVCLPNVFEDLSDYAEEPKSYWKLHMAKHRLRWYWSLNKQKKYYNSFISRFYYPFENKNKCENWIKLLKNLWKEREVVLIEGKKSRLGIGNDLFEGAKSIERILVPEEHAFLKYEEILREAKKMDKEKLILIAAGPTATVLAYDLYKAGYQAIDIGHIDIEYEWFLRQVKTKVKIENKYVCEAGAGIGVGELHDYKYLNEIIAKIE